MHPAIGTMPIPRDGVVVDEGDGDELDVEAEETFTSSVEPPLTIAEAKRRLAESLGVPMEAISITING